MRHCMQLTSRSRRTCMLHNQRNSVLGRSEPGQLGCWHHLCLSSTEPSTSCLSPEQQLHLPIQQCWPEHVKLQCSNRRVLCGQGAETPLPTPTPSFPIPAQSRRRMNVPLLVLKLNLSGQMQQADTDNAKMKAVWRL